MRYTEVPNLQGVILSLQQNVWSNVAQVQLFILITKSNLNQTIPFNKGEVPPPMWSGKLVPHHSMGYGKV